MARYIDADEFFDGFCIYAIGQDKGFIRAVKEVLEDTPTADVEEVKHGKWITDGDITECSNCHKEYVTARGMLQLKEFGYCPNCGAKMDGEKR